MADVKVFKSLRSKYDNEDLVHAISKKGIPVFRDVVEAEVSLVISGFFENPANLHGKTVLAYDATEWFPEAPVPKGFSLVAPILMHYYDDALNLSYMTTEEKADAIVRWVEDQK